MQQATGLLRFIILKDNTMSTTLKEGDKAPAFTGLDQNGRKISLSDYRGKKVILYFYPKDDTPGCTAQACNLRDNYASLKKKGFEIIGVSVDNEKSHKKFEEKYDLPFTLIADSDKKIVNSYGVFGEKKFMGRAYMGTMRTTFVIDEKGIIEKIIVKPDTKNHARQVLDALES
jgi:peroxiredoxin Q/BCP